MRVVLQAASLVLLARVLGAGGYGALAGSVALFMTIGQFTGLGSGIALVRHVARGGEPDGRFVATEHAYLLSGLGLFALAWPLSAALLHTSISPAALACLALAEIVAAPALLPLVYRHQAEERMFRSSAIGTLAPAARLMAVIAVAAIGINDVTRFAALYLACLVIIVAATLYLTWPRTDVQRPASSGGQAIREGLPYAVSGFAVTAGSELDKTVLLRIAGDAITGPYAAAYRIAAAATLPVNALILSASPRLFRGQTNSDTRLVGIMLAVVLGYALCAAAALWLLAPLAPWLLGHGFVAATPLLRALCIVVVTGSLRQFVVALLTTRDMQNSRNFIELAGVCISLLLLVLLVPQMGAYGAIVALAATDLGVIFAGSASIKLSPAAQD